jgi:hypothetical protein
MPYVGKGKEMELECSFDNQNLPKQLKVERKPHDTLAVTEMTRTTSTTLLLPQMREKTSTSDLKVYCLKVMKGTGLRPRTS